MTEKGKIKNKKAGKTGLSKKTGIKSIPASTINRLSKYLRALEVFRYNKEEYVSSAAIAKAVASNPSQVRKDFSYFGGFGSRGLGYNVKSLISAIENILGLSKGCISLALAGVGNLGTALLNYNGFKSKGFKVVAAFDQKLSGQTGKMINSVFVHDIDSAPEVIKDLDISIVLIAVPAHEAQATADIFIKHGIKGFLNYAPYIITVPDDVFVKHADMAMELETINFMTNNLKQN